MNNRNTELTILKALGIISVVSYHLGTNIFNILAYLYHLATNYFQNTHTICLYLYLHQGIFIK